MYIYQDTILSRHPETQENIKEIAHLNALIHQLDRVCL